MTKYLIEWTPDNWLLGEKIPTRGNDEEFPTFILEDGRRVGRSVENVVELIDPEEE